MLFDLLKPQKRSSRLRKAKIANKNMLQMSITPLNPPPGFRLRPMNFNREYISYKHMPSGKCKLK